MEADATKFFEDAARRMGVTPARLAEVVNSFNDMTAEQLSDLCDRTGIDMKELSELRDQLALIADPLSRH